MKAIVILYEGRVLSMEEQRALARLVTDSAWVTDSIDLSVLSDSEVDSIRTAALTKVCLENSEHSEEQLKIETVLVDAAAILRKWIFNETDNEQRVIIKLVKAIQESSEEEREAVKNAIKVLGLYDNPTKLMKGLNIRRPAINALKTLCNCNLV